MRAADLFQQYRKTINPPYSRKDLLTIGTTLFILVVIPLTIITTTTSRDTRSRAFVDGAYSERMTIIHKDIEGIGFGDVDIIKKVTENGKEKIFLNDKFSSQKEIEPILKKAKGEVLEAATCPTRTEPLNETLTVDEGVTFCIYTTQVGAQDVYNAFKANGLEDHVKLTLVTIVENGLSMASVGGGCYPDDYPVQGCWVFDASIQIRDALFLEDANNIVAHEYGHVWENYYRWTNWKGKYDAYVDARGVLGDPRLLPGSASCWNPVEIIGDDYRVLFGKDQAGTSHCNRDITQPKNVPGLNEFLALTYTNNLPPPNYSPTPTDTANPTATFTSLTDGSTLTGDRVVVHLEALDDVAVHYVELIVDGKVFAVNAVNRDGKQGIPGLNDYRFLLNSTKFTNGNHTFQAKAYDVSGKSATSSTLTLNVSNTSSSPDTQPPDISITSPTSGTTVSGSVYVITSNSDNVGITKTELYVDNQLKVTDIIYPYALKIDTNTLTNGNHSFVVKAYDWAGNTGTSGAAIFNVNNTIPDTQDPVVTITSPANGAAVSGIVNIAATASDNVGVTRVDFHLDGSTTAAHSDTSSPYSWSWNTTTVSNGPHTLLAKAYDAANNEGASATVTVTVDNASPPKPGDLNSDGSVDIVDLSILLSNWETSSSVADINGDGIVDIIDLSILLSNWDG
jgi:hypothetical protein